MTIGEKILCLRNEQNISQKRLAKSMGVSVGLVAEWEADETQPSINDVVKLSEVFSIEVDSLVKDKIEGVVLSESKDNSEPSKNRIEVKKISLKVLTSVICVVVIGLIGVLCFRLWSKPFHEDTDAMAKAAESVVKIYCYDFDGNESATGSGFVVYNDKTVVTNYHVMENAYSCKISTEQDKVYIVEKILSYSKENDIAILELSEPTRLEPLELGNSNSVEKGETVVAIGSPLGLKNTISQGVLSGRVAENNMYTLQFTASISNGSSGGALFSDKGQVVGVTYASYVDGQNLNLAVPIELVDKLYSDRYYPKAVFTIYFEAHPYARLLLQYDNAVEVTIEDLQKDPEYYDGKLIKIETYISSMGDNMGSYGDYLRHYMFTNKENISGNYDNDMATFISSDGLSNIMGATMNIDESKINADNGNVSASINEYADPLIEVGDRVVIVGEFDFLKVGSAKGGRIFTNIIYRDVL